MPRPSPADPVTACLAALGLIQPMALLLIGAHAVTVALRCRPGGAAPASRSLAEGWLAATAAAAAVNGPVLVLAWRQRATLGPITHPRWPGWLEAPFSSWALLAAVGLTLACGIAASALAGGQRAGRPGLVPALCVPWMVVPPTALLAASSLYSPVYPARYLSFCLPAVALLAGAALDRLGWLAGTAALALIVIAAAPGQLRYRAAHGRNIRESDQIISGHERRGDAAWLVGMHTQYQRFAYPYGMASLRDINLSRTPAQAGNLTGTLVTRPVLDARLARVERVWLIGGGPREDAAGSRVLRRAGFRKASVWHLPGTTVRLYVRDSR